VKTDTFNIGIVQEKMVGEVMVERVDGRIYPAFLATSTYQPESTMGSSPPAIQEGSLWKAIGMLENGDYICGSTSAGRVRALGKPVHWDHCLFITPTGEPYGWATCHLSGWSVEWNKKPGKIFRPAEAYEEGSLKQDLLYNGKSKDVIKLQYREYRDTFARPAFYQDLMYDLSESRIIGFRGMTVEVIEATNSIIKFLVKTPMN
jgi:hypothetical protein